MFTEWFAKHRGFKPRGVSVNEDGFDHRSIVGPIVYRGWRVGRWRALVVCGGDEVAPVDTFLDLVASECVDFGHRGGEGGFGGGGRNVSRNHGRKDLRGTSRYKKRRKVKETAGHGGDVSRRFSTTSFVSFRC